MSNNDIGTPAWQQTNRLLNLITPLGKDVLLAETLNLSESLGPVVEHAGFHLHLSVLSSNAGIDLTRLLGQPARLDLQTAFSRQTGRPFHGHITQIVRLGANGGFARYALTVEPWLAFLGHNRDSYLFQDKTVIDIVDELFDAWKGQGKLAPAWTWRLADPARYPKRGMTMQYRESDLAFLKRLLAEEGLFYWFEHQADSGDTLGSHTLVIADHNGAFADNGQPRFRYTQSGATLSEDSLDRWTGLRQLDTTDTHASSWDYRSLSSRPQAANSAIDNGDAPRTAAWFDPGQYAWPTAAHGERLLGQQRQAVDARLKQFFAEGSVRTAMPGTTFSLADHPEHDRDAAEQARFLIVEVRHRARNNLAEVLPEALDEGLAFPADARTEVSGVDFYRGHLRCLRATLPWRPLLADAQGRQLHPRPTVQGTLTAVVVGDEADGATHTDRDLRVRVQFPWQRGSKSAARQAHPAGENNAPASHKLGVWLRVLSPLAGGNWGGHFTPRPGQEVLVAFLHGNIDRPVVVGAVYNGQGNENAPGNRLGAGTMAASANAPAFFAGTSGEHAHRASLSGIKSQQGATSRSGQGGSNRLVFDDTPGESRIELATSEYQSRLQLGHLKQQTDNARQRHRGHGAELATGASLALRAGSGLLLSADARRDAGSTHLDSREPIAQTQAAASLARSLAETAARQQAALPGDAAAEALPALAGWQAAGKALAATASRGSPAADGNGAGNGDEIKATQGGGGTVPAWSAPRLQFAAPAGIAQLTPGNMILAAGQGLAVAAGQDLNLIAQGNLSLAVKAGIALFTVGQAGNPDKPNTETGIHLHAATGQVSLQSQRGKTAIAADKKVTLASTAATLSASAKTHLLATAQGAYLKIEGGNIELHAPKKVELKASLKNLTGAKSASVPGAEFPQSSLNLKKSDIELSLVDANGKFPASESLSLSIQGDKRNESVTAGKTVLKDLLPGLLSGKQGNRKS